MTANEFPLFYQAVHGFPPFPWQTALAARIAQDGTWPDSISIPTACGKTSVIDAAIYCLALQADRPPGERSARLRTFFVIDRRIVVDEAAAHAMKLAEALRKSLASDSFPPVVRAVAERLLSFGGSQPLKVALLRGGVYRDDRWVQQPNQPLICLTTVDQLGSRLLFRGYHLSESQRPVHAALAANDSLVVIDEAHLSHPFIHTLSQICRYQTWAEKPVTKGLRFVQMSATVRNGKASFSLQGEDYHNPILLKRLAAKKMAELREATDFESDAAEAAQQLAKEPRVKVVGVIVNRVGSARSIYEKVKAAGSAEAVLLIGRIRPWDRDRLLNRFLPRMKAGRSRAQDQPLFVVATQTVEVGADLDFDALVTEAAPLDALMQRFGRLDRLGELGSSRAVILLRKESRAGTDPIYGEPLRTTWTWLEQHARGKKSNLGMNFGVRAMQELLARHGSDALYSEASAGPLLFPAHIETWVQTSPTPVPDPDVAPFLHGPEALNAADIQIVWRADLVPENRANWTEIVSLAPPIMREALPISIAAARAWLRGRAALEVADTEGRAAGEAREAREEPTRAVLLWRGPDHSRVEDNPYRIAPGDTIVAPAIYGGADEFGWAPLSTTPVRDVADECANEMAEQGLRKCRLRVHADLLFPAPDPFREQFEVLLRAVREAREEDEPFVEEKLGATLAFIREKRPGLEAVFEKLETLGFSERFYPSGNELILTARKLLRQQLQKEALVEVGEDATDEDDTSSMTDTKITLAGHSAGVARVAGQFGRACELPDSVIEDLLMAAPFHDAGKSDPRFQAMLHGGNAALAMAEEESIAKSGLFPYAVAQYREVRRRSGYPPGARHEFTSVALARQARKLESAHDRELVLHLIGTHHGYGRPFPPVCRDPNPVPVTYTSAGECLQTSSEHGLARLEAGWTDQFWVLVQRYGFWGLAYLEAILRLADCAQSRKEQDQ